MRMNHETKSYNCKRKPIGIVERMSTFSGALSAQECCRVLLIGGTRAQLCYTSRIKFNSAPTEISVGCIPCLKVLPKLTGMLPWPLSLSLFLSLHVQ